MRRAALALLSALLLWAAFPPLAWAPAGWLALAPLLMALDGTFPRTGLRLGFLFGFSFFAAATCWFWTIFGWRSLGLWAFEGLSAAVFGLLVAGAGSRGMAWHLLGVPAFWVGTEWLRTEANPLRFGWFVLGLSQSSSPRMLQAADLAGAYGLSFLMVLVSSGLVFALRKGLGDRPRRLALGAALGAMIAVWGYGGWALGRWSMEGDVPAAVIQGEEVAEEALAALTRGQAGRKPRLVVWPELAIADEVSASSPEMARLQALAREMDAALVVGCKGTAPGTWRNIALVLGPDGEVLGDYTKHVPVQFFDDGVAGTGYPVFATPAGRLGACICYDLDFPWVTRGLVRAGAEILAVPTLDLERWGSLQHAQHTANARVRAVEHRRFVVRACSSGTSQVIAPDGRIVAAVGGMAPGAAVGKVAPVSARSPYDRAGWLLAPACAAWGAGVGLWLLRERFKRRQA